MCGKTFYPGTIGFEYIYKTVAWSCLIIVIVRGQVFGISYVKQATNITDVKRAKVGRNTRVVKSLAGNGIICVVKNIDPALLEISHIQKITCAVVGNGKTFVNSIGCRVINDFDRVVSATPGGNDSILGGKNKFARNLCLTRHESEVSSFIKDHAGRCSTPRAIRRRNEYRATKCYAVVIINGT